jgi:3-hydroxyisobutyrate dehydrogenase-like beta-hydroxyacid dehydrogenase
MRQAATPPAAAEYSDLLFSMLTDARAVEAVAHGPDGLSPGRARAPSTPT